MYKFTHPFTGQEVEMSEDRYRAFKIAYPNVQLIEETSDPSPEADALTEEKPKRTRKSSSKKIENNE